MKPKWIAHNQNEMPKRLKPETLVVVMLKCYVQQPPFKASFFDWGHSWRSFDILAYQIVEG